MQRLQGTSLHRSTHVASCRPRFTLLRATRSGPTGLDIGNKRVTSPQAWNEMLRILKSKGVKMISPQELQFLLDGDSSSQPLIIDIRPTSEYDKGFITGAINVPFYKPIEGWSPFKIARRLGFAAFGVSGTEPNSEFESQVLSAVKGKGSRSIIIYCLMGGSLDQVAAQSIPNLDDQASIQRVKKLQTRSMVAAYQLVDVAGLDAGVSILSGGYSGWASGGRSVSMMVDE